MFAIFYYFFFFFFFYFRDAAGKLKFGKKKNVDS